MSNNLMFHHLSSVSFNNTANYQDSIALHRQFYVIYIISPSIFRQVLNTSAQFTWKLFNLLIILRILTGKPWLSVGQ